MQRDGPRTGFSRQPHGLRGAAAVEFAFVFPILFLLIYGVIVYSYVFVLQESLTFAAQEAAEAAVKVAPDVDDADALRDANARATAQNVLRWLPESQRRRVLGSSGEKVGVAICQAGTGTCPSDSDAITVTLTFDVTTPTELFPVLNLYIVGRVPPLPAALVAQATARI
jgi:Flp pilus assembly protein TadG